MGDDRFGGGCGLGDCNWIWIILIIILVCCCCPGIFSGFGGCGDCK